MAPPEVRVGDKRVFSVKGTVREDLERDAANTATSTALASRTLATVLFFAATFSTAVVPFPCTAQESPRNVPPKGSDQNSAVTDATEEQEEINVRNADISAILRIFSRKTKRNYLLDERVRGKVSMFLPGRLSADDSQKILDSVLALKGFAAVPISGNLWKVIPAREAKQSTIPTLGLDVSQGDQHPATPLGPETTSPQVDSTVITKLVPLKHSPVEEVQPILSQLVSPDGLISQFASTNTLVIIDYEDNVARLAKMVDSLDVPFSDSEMVIIPIKYADAVDISQKLADLLGTGDQGGSGARARAATTSGQPAQNIPQVGNRSMPPAPPPPPGMPNPGALGGGMERRAREPKIMADERTNSIIVVADETTTARIRALVAQLDSKVDLSTNRFYVYRCQHAQATEIAQVLSGLMGGGGGGLGQSPQSGSSLSTASSGGFGMGGAGGLGSNQGRGSMGNASSRLQGTQRRPGTPFNQGQASSGASSVQLGDNLAVTADPDTNSLIISASKADYEKLLALIQRLDIKRRQVLVEAMILEVSIDDSRTLGSDFIASTGGADGAALAISNLGGDQGLAGLLSNPSQISGFAAAAASSGTIKLPNNTVLPSQAIMVSAAQNNQNVNVLSSPTLLTTDNEEAQIVVGQNVPFLTGTGTNNVNLNNTFNQIERQDVGITLRITPQISSNNFVTLRIFTDVSAVIPTADTSLGPTTTVRSSETTVITRDGQMIVIGGLIADRSSDSTSGVPFFQDVPFFGTFFRRSTDDRRRTNLLTFLTPRIVADQYDAREATIEHRDRLQTEMEVEGQFPHRREVLNSPRIDEVTELASPRVPEQQGVEQQGPGTILPPSRPSTLQGSPPSGRSTDKGKAERSVPAPNQGQQPAMSQAPLIHEGEITVSISPELPTEMQGNDGALRPMAAANQRSASANRGTQPPISSTTTTAKPFVLLRSTATTPLKNAPLLPFPVSPRGYVAVVVPASLRPERQLFETGGTYTYEVEGGEGSDYVVVGTFPSPQQGAAAAAEDGLSWYELSPTEVIRFGEGPWRRK